MREHLSHAEPSTRLHAAVLTPAQRRIKRAFDVTLAAALLIPGLPIMGVVWCLVRLTSPGAALFRQTRVGEGGRRFTMIKFRTMTDGAEADCPDLKLPDDPRVTRVGAWLRRTSLDELPQLFNVLGGSMSLVGPRPELPQIVDQYEAWQHQRFSVPQGLTGWWQINGRSAQPMHLHTEYDLYYITHYSLALDAKILLRTVWVVLRGRGAY